MVELIISVERTKLPQLLSVNGESEINGKTCSEILISCNMLPSREY